MAPSTGDAARASEAENGMDDNGRPRAAPTEVRHQARHQARILAMQTLYEADIARHATDAVLDRLIDEGDYPPATVAFARRLVTGVLAHLDEIDPLIAEAAPTWPLSQMAKIDKSILRLAVHEVLNEPEIPYKAAINEAVEIAKLYGSDSSSRFVNGVLGTIAARRPGAEGEEPGHPR
jgi:transcription antitermination protein NusB